MHSLDVRATAGRLTQPTDDTPNPRFRLIDIKKTFDEVLPGEYRVNLSVIHREMGHMAELGMIHEVERIPIQQPGGGNHYERTLTERSLALWEHERAGALLVAKLYPDAPQYKVWQGWETATAS